MCGQSECLGMFSPLPGNSIELTPRHHHHLILRRCACAALPPPPPRSSTPHRASPRRRHQQMHYCLPHGRKCATYEPAASPRCSANWRDPVKRVVLMARLLLFRQRAQSVNKILIYKQTNKQTTWNFHFPLLLPLMRKRPATRLLKLKNKVVLASI